MYIYRTGHRFLTDKGILFPGPPIRVVSGDPIREISISDTDNDVIGGSSWNSPYTALQYIDTGSIAPPIATASENFYGGSPILQKSLCLGKVNFFLF